MSPLVSIPRMPVPLILSTESTLCSWSNRITDGNNGRECSMRLCGGGGVDVEGVGADSDFGVVGSDGADCWVGSGFTSSTGGWRFEISSPSSASRAMTLPTGTFLVPS